MSESLKAATSGGQRRALDFYPTPPAATLALLPWIKKFPQPVWEPAAGDGSIVRILRGARHKVVATDIHRRDFPLAGTFDFLSCLSSRGSSIVTNPPFNLVDEFIDKALFHTDHVALLLKSTVFHAAKRTEAFRSNPPTVILALNWRLDFTGAGAPHRDCIWVIWAPRESLAEMPKSLTGYEILEKPGS